MVSVLVITVAPFQQWHNVRCTTSEWLERPGKNALSHMPVRSLLDIYTARSLHRCSRRFAYLKTGFVAGFLWATRKGQPSRIPFFLETRLD
jgi:hypothetical protein